MEVVMAASIDCAPHAEKKFPPTLVVETFFAPVSKKEIEGAAQFDRKRF
jgi:hypothetical protein